MCVYIYIYIYNIHTHNINTRRSELGAFGEESVMCFRSSGIKDETDHLSKQNQRRCYESSEKSETILCAKWYARAHVHTHKHIHTFLTAIQTRKNFALSSQINYDLTVCHRDELHIAMGSGRNFNSSFKFFNEFRNNQTSLGVLRHTIQNKI